ncbi:MAG: transketolase [Chloroflexi bacterium RBG_16_54_18]|nr:MAG: transketolase [Chloroflexi bacterium RBG_16_54_18]
MGKAKNKSLEVTQLTHAEVLQDYQLAFQSRQVSYIGRREVMSGKAKFGIFGDGKELPQVAMAHAFRKGDWRSGYYRDQTLMFGTSMLTPQQFFAQLYAHADVLADPASAGRTMNANFASRSLNPDGSRVDLTSQCNSAADVSPTASQMPRAVGLAYASKLFRQLEELKQYTELSKNGDEIVFATIGNASTAEGLFWESINAIGVLRCPAIVTIYDDGYGISVANESQIAKENISELLEGFRRPPGECCDGFDIYTVKGWDYPGLLQAYLQASQVARVEHMPSIIHVTELTQPQGHSTSGSHERYKTRERLDWEAEFDCNKKFREWIIQQSIASVEQLATYEAGWQKQVEEARKLAWEAYILPIEFDRRQAAALLEALEGSSVHTQELNQVKTQLTSIQTPLRRDISAAVHRVLTLTRGASDPSRQRLVEWFSNFETAAQERYDTYLYDPGAGSALNVPEIKPVYGDDSPLLPGFEVLNAGFDSLLQHEPRLIVFGQDVGRLGDVNQGMRGMQEKYGLLRVSDTGIREATILGQAIGMALRGLRPIAEIQYLDYLLYALQIISDDLASLSWRTRGGQKAPVIVRTRGHRLEGVWHSGSPMAGILNLVRGMHVLVPRDMTRAAGFYNTLLQADEPALVVEVLNGYRLRERLPQNIGGFTVPLGVPEVLRLGTDLTLVTYGACCRIALEAADRLSQAGIQAEVIDVQTLLPFDVHGSILESLKKTSRILLIDEDVPGGTSAYMLREVLEVQGGYSWLDAAPRTLPGKPHRPAYGSDGDYWSKPNAEAIFDSVYEMMHEADPTRYPALY